MLASGTVLETADELATLQRLLNASLASSTDHLRAIIHGDRVLSAEDLVALLTGMKVLAVATVTVSGEPRISAVDGHFLHSTWDRWALALNNDQGGLRSKVTVEAVDGVSESPCRLVCEGGEHRRAPTAAAVPGASTTASVPPAKDPRITSPRQR